MRGNVFNEEECPKTHLPHLQFMVRFDRAHCLCWVIKHFESTLEITGIHWEIVHDFNKCYAYCTKEETRIAGSLPHVNGDMDFAQGKDKITDLVALHLLGGAQREEIVRDFPGFFLLHGRAIDNFYRAYIPPEPYHYEPIEVHVLWGSSGMKKTGFLRASRPDHYVHTTTKGVWFDGYQGESVLILDDIDDSLPFGMMKDILEGHRPLQLPIKGGFVYARWKLVLIASNIEPRDWYPVLNQAHRDAIMRRLTSITHVTEPLTIV